MTSRDVQTLVDYNYWARDRVLAAVSALPAEQYGRDLGNSFRSIRDTLVHVYSAEWIWYSRWQGVSPTVALDPSPFVDVPALESAWRGLEVDVRRFVASLDDEGLSIEIDYKNLAGQANRSSFAQMIQHVVNHGTYHRGQVTTMLRQLGAKPPASLDLIAYYRK